MSNFEKLLRRAKNHDNEAMMELLLRFIRKMIAICRKYGLGNDEDLQAYLMLCFLEDVYKFRI